MNDDERVRRLLGEAVSDVEPREALGSIHARTKVSSMRRRRSWVLGAGAAVVATAATVAAVTVLGEGTTRDEPDVAAPATSSSATPTPSPSPTGSADVMMASVPVYYVGDTSRGAKLFREFHRVDTGGDPVSAAVAEAVDRGPDDPDYRTDWPAGTTAVQAHPAGTPDVITIDVRGNASLHDRPAGMSREQADLAVQQVIYTAQAAQQSRDAVQLLLNGRHTDSILGVATAEPLAQGDATEVLAQVWVIDPAQGAKVSAPFKVSGLASAFEANVQWELKAGDRVVKRGFTTAQECCRMVPYSFTVNAPPGEYTLVVHDSDPSGGEGFAPWQDTKQITVLP